LRKAWWDCVKKAMKNLDLPKRMHTSRKVEKKLSTVHLENDLLNDI